jgi:hypothetical protein
MKNKGINKMILYKNKVFSCVKLTGNLIREFSELSYDNKSIFVYLNLMVIINDYHYNINDVKLIFIKNMMELISVKESYCYEMEVISGILEIEINNNNYNLDEISFYIKNKVFNKKRVSLDDVSNEFNMTIRTMQNFLKKNNTSFRELYKSSLFMSDSLK